MYDNYLAHYGILGMKWGVRRFQPYSVRGRKSGEGGKEVGEARKKSLTKEQLLNTTNPNDVWKHKSELNDRELRERVNRIQTEQQLKQIIDQSSKKGESFIKKVFKNTEKMAVSALSLMLFKGIKWAASNPKEAIEVGKDAVDVAKWMLIPWNP